MTDALRAVITAVCIVCTVIWLRCNRRKSSAAMSFTLKGNLPDKGACSGVLFRRFQGYRTVKRRASAREDFVLCRSVMDRRELSNVEVRTVAVIDNVRVIPKGSLVVGIYRCPYTTTTRQLQVWERNDVCVDNLNACSIVIQAYSYVSEESNYDDNVLKGFRS